MGLGCGLSTIKYILFIFNLLCSLCGIALIAIGGIVLSQIDEIQELNQDMNIAVPAIVCIVLGSLIFLISFFGCCGAIRESYCMTTMYGIFLFVLIVAQIVLAAYVFVYAGDVSHAFQKGFDTIFDKRDANEGFTKIIDGIQQNLECCGKSSAADYGFNTWPVSCCAATSRPCIPYVKGCTSSVGKLIDNGGILMGWVAIGVAAIELVGLISACCLANGIRNLSRRHS